MSEKEQILSEVKEFSFLTERMLFAIREIQFHFALNDAISLRSSIDSLIGWLNREIHNWGSQ